MVKARAVTPHSFFLDLDPAVIRNADPDPALQNWDATFNLNFVKVTL